ncbi:WD40 repeat domain-containing protein [Streptosporangium amethystogenes subsp. fukuiense]|uniref:WD40 repeat domain-containing protein n=1 Tax=Streptosporangium amethystogenes subsp. fukuiense TaxID=698418 RepID=A0ABW2SSB2_9ACTN
MRSAVGKARHVPRRPSVIACRGFRRRIQRAICPESLEYLKCVAWSHDGTRLVTDGHDRVIRVWDAADGRQLTTLTAHQDWVISLAWSPTQQMLASTSDDRTARIWNIAAGEQHTVLRGHDGWVDCVSWSADGTSVVTGSADRTARIWDVASGR